MAKSGKKKRKALKQYPHKCSKGELDVCDFCLHFLFYRTKNGSNIDGSGWCGLKRKDTDAGDGCKDYYCKAQWKKNMKLMYK